MEELDNTLSVIGSIISIVSAIWAFFEARKALGAASRAEEVRDQIIERRIIVEVSRVYAETTRILKTVSAVGPSCNQALLRGVSTALIAKEIEEYARFLNEQSVHFSDAFDNRAKELCSDLREDIEALADAKSFDEKKNAGKRIYYKINNFLPIVKMLSDEKRESIKIN